MTFPVEWVEIVFQTANASVSFSGVSTSAGPSATVTGPKTGGVATLQGQFADAMAMTAPPEAVAEYLNRHPQWFATAATPLKVEPLGPNSYAMTLGRFGALGHEVEPCFGLELVNSGQDYRIRTVPVPGQTNIGYEVDFNAVMVLNPAPSASAGHPLITQVEWQLCLEVQLQLPRFLQALPHNLVQQSGDRLLHQIVRQISRRLTQRVQQDFHTRLGLPLPPRRPVHL
jgi:hypothetical protein